MPARPKQKVFRSRKLLNAARDRACVMCGARDGTVVAAHYSGVGAGILGRGAGRKCHDFACAWLCYKCHCRVDQYAAENGYERFFDFMMAIMKTLAILFEEGLLEVANDTTKKD